jgi:four helix bundle protein|tara:strand:+ start:439 stop:870 length:432 start_codon:yes stop_codon:yes gene_type:complete
MVNTKNQLSGYEKLEVYNLSFKFVVDVYKRVENFNEKDLNLASQLKRSVASIPLNIAEGNASTSKRDYLNHVNYAFKSATEVKVTLRLCHALNYITDDDLCYLLNQLDDVRKRVYGLRKVLINNSNFRAGDRFNFYLKDKKKV